MLYVEVLVLEGFAIAGFRSLTIVECCASFWSLSNVVRTASGTKEWGAPGTQEGRTLLISKVLLRAVLKPSWGR